MKSAALSETPRELVRRLKPYPAYKKSGIKSLGDVPVEWQVVKLKRVCSLAYGEALSSGSRSGREVEVYGSNGPVGEHDRANTLAPCLVIGRKGSFGKVNFSQRPVFAIDTTFFVDRRHTRADLRWLYYVLIDARLDSATKDSAIPGLDREDAYAREVLLPPEPEQRAIATFLDRETARVDALVAKKERLIELLQEKRTALITHTVTKGLDPNAPTKDSGIEWVGDIPLNWDVRPLRWAISIRSGDALPNSEFELNLRDGLDVAVIGGNGVMGFTNRGNIAAESIALGRVGALCGNVHLVNPPAWVTDNALVISGISAFDRKYLALLLRVLDLNRWASQNAQPLITGGLVKEQTVCTPLRAEQHAIVELLERETDRSDGLVAKIREAIERVMELRTALISAAVTGKIDVREEAA